VPVLISGATGFYAESINGFFTPSSEKSLDGRVVYKKCDCSAMILEHCCGHWALKPVWAKGQSSMQCAVVGGCAFEQCVGRDWYEANRGKWQSAILTITVGSGVDKQVLSKRILKYLR
jgi:hypothetical protein